MLETVFTTDGGRVRLVDALAMRAGGREHPRRQLLRFVEGVEGEVELAVEVVPRFDYGSTKPWMRDHGEGFFTAVGGDSGLLLVTDLDLAVAEDLHALTGRVRLGPGDCRRLGIGFVRPEEVYPELPPRPSVDALDDRLDETLDWWRAWCSQAEAEARRPAILRSAMVLRGLVNAPTGAIAAAATTSLPEAVGGARNWDYRFTWIRDSAFVLGSLDQLGFAAEADGFRYFVERTTAGSGDEIQPLYGIGGEHLLPEIELDHLDGYRGSRPVRIGNRAYRQLQMDTYGHLLELAWRAAQRGRVPDADYWRFLRDVVETALQIWSHPDRGIWEVRDADHHFVHSKAMCWAAVDRGIRLAESCGHDAPLDRWHAGRDEIRSAIETQGYDPAAGTFVRDFGRDEVDAALLLLPRVDFVAYDDPRMVRTVERIRRDLTTPEGLILRYHSPDGLPGPEARFLACTFWLVECLALSGKRDEAKKIFERTEALANDLGLFSEEYDPDTGEMLGNFPQGLTHYSHIAAAVALEREVPPQEPGE